MTYTDLIFDLYGTLVDIHTEESPAVWDKCAMFFGFCGVRVTGDELRRDFYRVLAEREARAGQDYECFPEVPFEEIMTRLLIGGGVTEGADGKGVQAAQLFRICSIEYIRRYPYVTEALKALRDKGYRLWLLSNAQRVFTACELRLLGLDGVFDGVYLSSDHGCRKPDERFYRVLLSEQGLDPARCLMIGNDRETDIAGAARSGIATLYMHTALTPSHQAVADESLRPDRAPDGCRHFEYEGDDWEELSRLIALL